MTEKEQLEAILDVFTTDGWKLIVKDIEDHYDAINKVYGVENERQMYTLQGELLKLNWFMNMQEWYQTSLDSIDDSI